MVQEFDFVWKHWLKSEKFVILHQFFYILIQKGRGTWPNEALTTCYLTSNKVSNPAPQMRGQISQTSRLTNNIFIVKAHLTPVS